ncbi:MAG: DUF4124 domain-containing protein [Woeseiaceae bacterium]|nr:DUF4124 domain-containing protein [Woeseiaceae bacterium]
MRIITSSVILCVLLPLSVAAQQERGTYKWEDDEGVIHYGDRIPPEYADKPKERLNDQGVAVEHLEGKKTEEQLAAEKKAAELELQRELQRRADQALLNTYVSIEEIEMHRDRRVELFRAQARVTELYLRNLARRLDQLKLEAGRYKPYSADPNAETIDPSLVAEIQETEGAIDRHESNLSQFRNEEKDIRERFDGDIKRFKRLKGLDDDETGLAGKAPSESTSVAQIVPE